MDWRQHSNNEWLQEGRVRDVEYQLSVFGVGPWYVSVWLGSREYDETTLECLYGGPAMEDFEEAKSDAECRLMLIKEAAR